MTEQEIYEKYEEIWARFLDEIGVGSKKWYFNEWEGTVFAYWLKDDCDQDYRIYLQEKLENWKTKSADFCEEIYNLCDYLKEGIYNLYDYLECALSYEHEGLKQLILFVRDLFENDLISELDELGLLDSWKIYSD